MTSDSIPRSNCMCITKMKSLISETFCLMRPTRLLHSLPRGAKRTNRAEQADHLQLRNVASLTRDPGKPKKQWFLYIRDKSAELRRCVALYVFYTPYNVLLNIGPLQKAMTWGIPVTSWLCTHSLLIARFSNNRKCTAIKNLFPSVTKNFLIFKKWKGMII